MANTYYSGQGSLYIAERDPTTGIAKGFLPLGNVPELSIDITTSQIEHKESETGQRLTDLVLVTEKKGTFTCKVENLNLDNLALGLWGESTVVVGATVTDEAVKLYTGKRMPLAHQEVSGVVVTGVGGTPTYALGGDYTVDATNGTIAVPATGSTITDGLSVLVDYTYGGYSQLDSFTKAAAPERWLRFEGLNTIDDSRVIIDIFRAQFDPLTGYNLLSSDVASVQFKGAILADLLRTTGSKFFRQRNL